MKLKLPSEFSSYKPKVNFSISSGPFIVKIAETEQELIGAFHLRHNVFCKERRGLSLESQLSIDEFDIHADQLVIIDKENSEVAGTYRLISSVFNSQDHFSNWKYFDISKFLNKKSANGLEMEWACNHKNIRSSQAIRYIWLGLARYFKQTVSSYLFGQVNVLNINALKAASIYNTFLKRKAVAANFSVFPKKEYAVEDFDNLLLKAKPDPKVFLNVSRLFLWYLKMGAKIEGHPMFDPEFNSYGFFLSLDFKNISNANLVNRYQDAVQLKKDLS